MINAMESSVIPEAMRLLESSKPVDAIRLLHANGISITEAKAFIDIIIQRDVYEAALERISILVEKGASYKMRKIAKDALKRSSHNNTHQY